MITVKVEPSRKLVRACMSGFLSIEDVEGFSREEQSLVDGMGWKSGEFLLLVDTDGAVIQSREVVAAFQNLVLHSRLKARRIAVVRHDALTRLQTQRIIGVRDNTAMFTSSDEAIEWLLAFEEDSVPRRSVG